MSKRKAYCDGYEGQEKRERGIISIDLTKDDDRSQIYTPKSETSDDNDDAEFSSDQESFEDKEENYQSPLDKDLPNLVYYRGDKKLPIYSYTSPNLKRIFQICLKKDIPADRMAEIKPTSISSTSTFVVDQPRRSLKTKTLQSIQGARFQYLLKKPLFLRRYYLPTSWRMHLIKPWNC